MEIEEWKATFFNHEGGQCGHSFEPRFQFDACNNIQYINLDQVDQTTFYLCLFRTITSEKYGTVSRRVLKSNTYFPQTYFLIGEK